MRTFGPQSQGFSSTTTARASRTHTKPDAFGMMAENLVLRHYAFADEWFKLNATFNLVGNLIEPGPPDGPFAVNCGIATPMVRIGHDISAVDLFMDVLIGIDVSYRIVDRDDFEQSISARLISPSEARCEAGLERLVHWIESGRLLSLLAETAPASAAHAPSPLPFKRTPIRLVPRSRPLADDSWGGCSRAHQVGRVLGRTRLAPASVIHEQNAATVVQHGLVARQYGELPSIRDLVIGIDERHQPCHLSHAPILAARTRRAIRAVEQLACGPCRGLSSGRPRYRLLGRRIALE